MGLKVGPVQVRILNMASRSSHNSTPRGTRFPCASCTRGGAKLPNGGASPHLVFPSIDEANGAHVALRQLPTAWLVHTPAIGGNGGLGGRHGFWGSTRTAIGSAGGRNALVINQDDLRHYGTATANPANGGGVDINDIHGGGRSTSTPAIGGSSARYPSCSAARRPCGARSTSALGGGGGGGLSGADICHDTGNPFQVTLGCAPSLGNHHDYLCNSSRLPAWVVEERLRGVNDLRDVVEGGIAPLPGCLDEPVD
eukprot:10705431-Alexandrium_andersonii.AAC.1